MGSPNSKKLKILIADDSEMNRAILSEMLGNEYEILEAENGVQALIKIQEHETELSLVLLDIVMPEMDGYGVLKTMNQRRWIDFIPVIMISAESSSSHVEKAYNMGVTDFISRPFDARIVHKRVVNTILLYAKQKKLMDLVTEQVYEKEKQSGLMIEILSHIVEFRNGESGMHVLHIRTLTDMLLHHLVQMTDRYPLSRADMAMIGIASALHDVGKISIPAEILNKPGRLTNEEFAVMKQHSLIGANMLENLPNHQDEPLLKTAYEICRWHHERYDGRGYPDGLKGEEIPISAQIVSLADVYDALTSERVYKKAFSHEQAIQMILGGECGTMNPLLLQCLSEMADSIPELLENTRPTWERSQQEIADDLLHQNQLTASERTLQLLDHERMKYSFFAAMSEEIQFEYNVSPPMATLSSWGAEKLQLPETIADPLHDKRLVELIGEENIRDLTEAILNTTPEEPVMQHECKIQLPGGPRWMRFICRASWSEDEPPICTGMIGKVVDIHETRLKIDSLSYQAFHDEVTGLFNRRYAKRQIVERLETHTGSKFALAILDVDKFKTVNDTRGHDFGDRVLAYAARRMQQSVRSGDIVSRIGGDEFLIFLEYKDNLEKAVERIFSSLMGELEGFPISFSMGVAQTDAVGTDYEVLFHSADQALYTAKQSRGRYCFYHNSMKTEDSTISLIDKHSKPKTPADGRGRKS
ncbi:MAG: diguanylate cyclase [Provencibacterium sp.]|jgi:diguanylate cyclase (GGDEF)-like protein|nr:diguanylate cyclase [Provencibacterium sp.]